MSDHAEHRRLRPSGGCRQLHSFQVATIIYDATVSFCERFVDSRSRTRDQMVQAGQSDLTEPYRPWLAHENPAIVANVIICLIHQANYLLDRQIHALERQFVQQGGYSEQLAAARLRERGRSDRTDPTDQNDTSDQTVSPVCPICGGIMAVRTARKGSRAGAQFWGCAKYPACKGTRPF